jgi:outer membrane protein assembly factor BamB
MLSALNGLNGQPLWEKKLASINTPWLVGEYLFVLTEDNTLVALVKYDGRVRWTLQLQRFKDEEHKIYPIVWRGPVMVNGKLVVVNGDGEMRTIDAGTGSEIATISVADGIATTPVVAAGRLFVVDGDATLYSYQ